MEHECAGSAAPGQSKLAPANLSFTFKEQQLHLCYSFHKWITTFAKTKMKFTKTKMEFTVSFKAAEFGLVGWLVYTKLENRIKKWNRPQAQSRGLAAWLILIVDGLAWFPHLISSVGEIIIISLIIIIINSLFLQFLRCSCHAPLMHPVVGCCINSIHTNFLLNNNYDLSSYWSLWSCWQGNQWVKRSCSVDSRTSAKLLRPVHSTVAFLVQTWSNA